jgi:hypothetical protein
MSSESPANASPVPLHDRPYAMAALLFVLALVVRLVVIAAYPDPWQFDAYQRWAARDHLWVQVWLPATQVVVWTVAKLGGGILSLRVVMALIASATVAMGGMLAHRLGGIRGAWGYLPMALFGPYLLWSVVPYQESTLLFALFGGLLLSERYPRAGDLLIGALAFCRYEGWPLLLVYIAVQRRWSALLCLWGVAAYFGLDLLGLNEPYAASPDSFEDWEGLENKLNPRNAVRLFTQLWFESSRSGLQWIVIGAVLALWRRPWTRSHWVLSFAVLGQMAATVGWMFSLGIVFSRMTVIPGMVVGVISAAEVGRLWPRFPTWGKIFVGVFTWALMAWTVTFTKPDIDRMFRTMRYDVELVRVVERCPNEVWSITPRRHPGPRRRHDGCEVLQGLTDLRAGVEFVCEPWDWGGPEATLRARWSSRVKAYEVERLSGEPDESCGF